jgi:Ca2+-binding RTX toxin-like protein
MSESTTWTGTDASERFVGGPGDDVLNGTGGDDEILGGLGNDTIEGGSGADTIQGGGGNDLITDSDGILLSGGEGNDTISGGGGGLMSVVHGDTGDDSITIIPSITDTQNYTGAVYGGSGNDTLIIFSDAAEVHGDGFDVLTANSSVQAGSGDDIITIENATVFRVAAGLGHDTVVIRGVWGNNDPGFTIFDGIVIQLDDDEFIGGNDTLDASQFLAEVIAWGYAGDDTFIGQSANFASSFYGGDGTDSISGGSGDDYLQGGTGSDTIKGNSGNDTIGGGDGVDILSGGLGSDVFLYDFDGEGRKFGADATGTGVIYSQPDIITDFKTGDSGDQLDFRPLFSTLGYTGVDPFGDGWLKLEQDGNDILVKLDRTGSGSSFTETVARLQNTSIGEFTTFNALPAGPLDESTIDENRVPTGVVTISGTAAEDQILTAITSTISDTDGLGTFSYQWLRDGTPITGANSRTYTIADDDIGDRISVRITYTDGGGTTEILISETTSPVQEFSADERGFGSEHITDPTLEVVHDGNLYRLVQVPVNFYEAITQAESTYFEGVKGHLVTLTSQAENLTIWDALVEPYPSSYQEPGNPWIALSDASNEGIWVWQSGPEKNAPTTFQSWAGLEPSNTNNEDAATLYSGGRGAWNDLNTSWQQWYIVEFEGSLLYSTIGNHSPTGTVVISGNGIENQTLTAITSSISDEDGLGALSFQWFANGIPISGATGRSYTLTQNEVGKSITAQVTYTDGGGTTENLTSPSTSAIANVNDVPQLESNFIGNGFTNIPSPDSEFVLVSGTIANGGTTFLYGTIFVQYAYSGNTPVPYKVIIGNEADDFSNWESGKDITQFTTLSGDAYNNIITISEEAEISNQDIQIYVNSQFPYYVYPWYGVAIDIGQGLQISGLLLEGEVLSLQIPNVTDEDGVGAFRFQWLANDTPISGATSRFYTLTQNEVGKSITAQVSYTDGGGTTETVTSAETAAVVGTAPGTIFLTKTSDTYSGTDLSEIISTQGGDDIVTASKGNDQIDGGDGKDTVIYDGDQDAYTVTLGPSGVEVRDRRPDGNGTDTLINIEFLEFDTGDFANFNLDQFSGATSLNEDDFKGFIELYIAYFNRAPDAIGLNFWGTAYAYGTSMEQMANLFAPQEETLNTYPEGTSNTQFATAVYNNVLGRTPDQAGFDFWVGVLDAGGVTRDQFILEVLRGVQAASPDREYLDNKVDVGAYFAVHKGMSDTKNASAAMLLFDGTEESIQTVKQAIDAYYEEALDPNAGAFLMQIVGVFDDPFV